MSDHIRDAVLAPKSAGFAFTPITVLVLLGFIILWLGCGFYGIEDAIQMRAAIMANTPAIFWSSPGFKIGLFVFPYFMAPVFFGIRYLAKEERKRSAALPVVVSVIFLLIVGIASPDIVMSAIDGSFSRLAAAHGYEVCVLGSGKHKVQNLALPTLIQNGACSTGRIKSSL